MGLERFGETTIITANIALIVGWARKNSLWPTAAVLADIGDRLNRHGVSYVGAIEVAEDLRSQQRVVHVEPGSAPLDPRLLADVAAAPGLSGLSVSLRGSRRPEVVMGRPWVADRLDAFVPALASRTGDATLARHATSFFQANRFLTPTLTQRVLAAVHPGPLVDLYAGVGLFAVCAAAAGHPGVVAVEGDRGSAADLRTKAAPFGDRLRVESRAVEAFLASPRRGPIGCLIVDPPRTGMSREALSGVLASRAERIVYVSCDLATLGRAFRRTRQEMGSVNAELQESIAAVREVQAFNRADENIENFRLVNAANRDANIRAVACTSALAPSLEALGYTALAIVAAAGGFALLRDNLLRGTTISLAGDRISDLRATF